MHTVDFSVHMGIFSMPSFPKSLAIAALGVSVIGAAPAMVSAQNLPAGMITDTRKLTELPGLQGFLNLAPSEKSQFDIFYAVKIKHAPTDGVTLTLNDHGQEIPIHMARDGRISPMPTREQVNSGDTLTVVYPQAASEALRLRVFSTQPNGREYDAQGLVLGINQANHAMAKVGGVLVLAVPRLDRVYFIGSTSGTLETTGGQSQPLPTFEGNNDIPAGTPYYVPSQMPNGTKVHLNTPVRLAMLSTPQK
jgi:hypothetical protein